MDSDFQQRLDQANQIPLADVLLHFGLTPHRDDQALRYQNAQNSRGVVYDVIVPGQELWFDTKGWASGRGTVDLVLHLECGIPPEHATPENRRQAVEWLEGFKAKQAPAIEPPSEKKPPQQSFPPSLVEQVRRIPLDVLLSYHGLTPRQEGTTTRYKNDRVNIVVGGNSLWFDNAASVGGRGPIDLILHLKYGASPKSASPRDFQDAVQWLATFQPGTEIASPIQSTLPQPSQPRESFESQAARLALRDDARWPLVRSYLVGTRRLPTDLIDTLRNRQDLYPTFSLAHPERTGVCFIHRNLAGEPRGATIRPVDGVSNVPFSIGEKQGAWFTIGNLENASRLVVTEAPIDAMSYMAMKRPDETVVMAMSSSHVYQPVLRAAHERRWELVVGFDNDRAGHAGWERCRENHAILYPDDPLPVRITPAGKDWNDDLRLAPRHSHGRRL